MKGMVISLIAMLVSISIFSLFYLVASQALDTSEIVSRDIIAKRIYYKFQTISDSANEIIEKELADLYKLTMDVTVDEQPDYSYVTFTEKLPQELEDVDDFKEDLRRYERFAEAYLPEKNIAVETKVADIGEYMCFLIEPYNITYNHTEGFGQRQVLIKPENEDLLDNLNGYTINIKLEEPWNVLVGGGGEWAT